MPLSNAAGFWDDQASTFDDEPDHGLRDPATRAAWRQLLRSVLPEPDADIADLGCGTGSLSVLLAEDGYRVTGVDLAPKMVAAARVKATGAGVAASFREGDVSSPDLPLQSFDAVVARHVVWALPDPEAAIRWWAQLLRGHGRLVLIEGCWTTGAGIAADRLERIVRPLIADVEVHALTNATLWGRPIEDERYVMVART
jgi:SAM-dependent methyltransferase